MTAAAAEAPRHVFTPEQILAGITKALQDGDVAMVPGLVRLLAVQDPEAAQTVLDVIELARVVRGGQEEQ